MQCCLIHKGKNSLRSRRLEVADERENGRARRRHARGEGALARKAPENRFNSHSVSADIPIGREAPEGKINRAGRENVAVISKKSWSVQTVFTMERIDIGYASAEVARDKRFVESLQ